MSTIAQRLELTGATRRDFLVFCGKLMVVAPFGLAITSATFDPCMACAVHMFDPAGNNIARVKVL